MTTPELDRDVRAVESEEPPLLTVRALVKRYQGESVPAVDDVSLDVRPGELFTLLGPSGCGKTTTLRSVAGLEKPDAGHISVGDRTLFDAAQRINVPANRRGLAMVFQSYAIWPHLTVARNVSFPLDVQRRRRRGDRAEVARRVREVLEIVGLADLADRPATKLSGGQQQRLALARSLVVNPPLLLLDEPLSNLDAKLRESMRMEFKRLQRELGLTVVYVTHDQAEALAISSRIAVLNAGRIVQVGRPRDIYYRPESRFVAEFIGASTILDGTVIRVHDVHCTVRTAAGEITGVSTGEVAPDAQVAVSVRPETVVIEEAGATVDADRAGDLHGTVVTRAFLGDTVEHVVSVAQCELRARSQATETIPPGTTVRVRLDPRRTVVIPAAS